jgi:hypothetical protein
VYARQSAGPFSVANIGTDNLAGLSDGPSREIGFIGDSKTENIFVLELNAKLNKYNVCITCAVPQKFIDQYRKNSTIRVLGPSRNTYSANLAPVRAHLGVNILGFRANAETTNGRIPDEISSRGLSSIFCCDLHEGLFVSRWRNALSQGHEYNGSRSNIDVGSDLRLADALHFRDVALSSNASFNPERDCRNGQDESECRNAESEKGRWVFRRSLPEGFAWFVLWVGGGLGTLIGLAISGLAIWVINRPDKTSAKRKPHHGCE